MFKFLQSIDAKVITSAGGILLAAIAIWALRDLAVNKIDNQIKAFNVYASSDLEKKDRLAEAFTKNATAIEGNTKVMESLRLELRQK